MINSKAYAAGSVCPPPQEGALRLYANRFCPFVKRVLLVLKYFDVPHEVVNINLKSKPDWFLEKSPFGSVPVLEFDGKIIFESLICSTFLDKVYGRRRLHGEDAYKEAEQSMWIERIARVNAAFYACFKGDVNVAEKVHAAEVILKEFEAVCSGGLFGGVTANFLDLMIYPFFERFLISKEIIGVEFFDASKFPKLAVWRDFLANQKFVKDSFEDSKLQTVFIKQFLDPNCAIPDTDIGI